MSIKERTLSLALLLFSSFQLLAQPGSLDFSFGPNDVGNSNGLGFSAETFDQVEMIEVLPDGRSIMGGTFTQYNGTTLGNIVRLTPDGLVDGTFQTGTGHLGALRAIELDPAGGCFIGGALAQYNGSAIGALSRLNEDGSLSASYPAGSGPDGEVRAMLLQPDGKLIIGGNFTTVNGTPRARIARLEADGSLDTTFDPGTGANGQVYTIALQDDGTILIGGAFTEVNGSALNRIARLTPTGALDPTFSIGSGANGTVLGFAIQPDGMILVNGEFTSINGVARSRIARLDATGVLDATFYSVGASGGNILAMTLLQDGKIMVAGSFTTMGGIPRNRIARLGTNGFVDNAFDPGLGVGGWVRVMHELPDGRLLLGGSFNTYAGVWRIKATRISSAGVLDMTFNGGSGASGGVIKMVPQPDGRILLGGTFTHYNGVVRIKVARIHSDGTLDTTFDPGIGPATEGDIVRTVALQSDGKVLVGGSFLTWSGIAHRRLVRLMPNGALDPTFITGAGADSPVMSIATQPDGRILIGGFFTAYNGMAMNRLGRLDANGDIDPTFEVGSGFNSTVRDVVLLADGKLLVSGDFTNYNGNTVGRLVRLNADGGLDETFIAGSGANGMIEDIAVQSDGGILICGQFTTYAGTDRNRVARLLPDGSIDPGFTVGTGPSNLPTGILAAPGGQAYLVGAFTTYNGSPTNSIARLLANGSLDGSFNSGAGTGTSRTPLCLLLQPDGRLLMGGNFVAYDGIGRNYIARLHTLPEVLLQLQVMLGGTYDPVSGSMVDALRAQGLLPVLEGNSANGLVLVGYGGESVQAGMLGVQPGGNNAVDWIQVRFSTAADPGTPVALRNVLVRQDGHAMDLDGSNDIVINGIPPGLYYVSVHHRNHLGASTASPVALSPLPVSVDFTLPTTPTYGTDARSNVNGSMVLWPGDTNSDGAVSYVGANNDRDPILIAVGGVTPTNVISNVYSPLDVNLDGSISYTGTSNDRDIILETIGGVVPTAIRTQQIP
jgi:uncharacterized delta-60 repeat protein